MPGTREQVIAAFAPTEDTEACQPAYTALDEGQQYGGIDNPHALVRFLRSAGIDDGNDVAIRTASQRVYVQQSGCLPEQADGGEEVRKIAVDCPKEPSSRCETCILNFDGGEVALEGLMHRFDTHVFRR